MTIALARPAVPSSVRLAEVRAAIRRAALPFVVSRLALIGVTFIAAHMSDVAPSGGPPQATPTLHDLAWRWYFWDGANYTAIATAGYTRPERVAFFPLFPLLQHLAALNSPHVLYAGLLVANLACFAACVALEMLAPVRPGALPVSAFLLASPFAFFLAAPFTEAIFLALACGCLLALKRGALGWAILCCALATATRFAGVALLLPIAYTWLRSRGVTWRSVLTLAPALVASLAGLLAYSVYCLVTTGDPIAYATAERADFGHVLVWPWQTAAMVASTLSARALLDVLPVVVTLAVLIAGAKRLSVAEALYSAGALLLVLVAPVSGTDPLVSGGRYMLVIAPIYLVLHRWGGQHPWLGRTLLICGALLQAVLLTFELRHGWLP